MCQQQNNEAVPAGAINTFFPTTYNWQIFIFKPVNNQLKFPMTEFPKHVCINNESDDITSIDSHTIRCLLTTVSAQLSSLLRLAEPQQPAAVSNMQTGQPDGGKQTKQLLN